MFAPGRIDDKTLGRLCPKAALWTQLPSPDGNKRGLLKRIDAGSDERRGL